MVYSIFFYMETGYQLETERAEVQNQTDYSIACPPVPVIFENPTHHICKLLGVVCLLLIEWNTLQKSFQRLDHAIQSM